MKYAIPIPASNATSIWRMKKIIYNESILPNETVKTPASTVTRDFGEEKVFQSREKDSILDLHDKYFIVVNYLVISRKDSPFPWIVPLIHSIIW